MGHLNMAKTLPAPLVTLKGAMERLTMQVCTSPTLSHPTPPPSAFHAPFLHSLLQPFINMSHLNMAKTLPQVCGFPVLISTLPHSLAPSHPSPLP